MSELKLILKKLDQISNRLDLLEKKIETPDRKKSPPETPPNKVEEWKISQELMNRKRMIRIGNPTSMSTSKTIKPMWETCRGGFDGTRMMFRNSEGKRWNSLNSVTP